METGFEGLLAGLLCVTVAEGVSRAKRKAVAVRKAPTVSGRRVVHFISQVVVVKKIE
jgi:hypothetical protein